MIICTFSTGCYTVRSKSGKQGLDFEDSEQFGPSRINMRTGELSEIPSPHWFWGFYTPWRAAGRPTEGEPLKTPSGPLQRAVWVSDGEPDAQTA